MASSDEDEHQSNAGQKLSKDVLAVLDQFYVGGMTGWGMDHCRDIEQLLVLGLVYHKSR